MQIFYTSVEGQRATFQVRGTKFTPRKGIELLRKKKKKKFHGVKWNVRIKKRKQQGQPYTLKKEKLHTQKDEVLGYVSTFFSDDVVHGF